MKIKQSILPLLGLGFVLFCLVAWPATTHAFDSRSGETVVIEPGEVIEDDLYLSGTEIIVDGTIQGDLVVMGETIIVNGTVEGDILGMGQSLIINGDAQDDVRIMGMALTLGENATIADDFIGLGYSLETKRGSLVDGDLLFFGAQALLAGTVTNDVQFGGASLDFQGEIGGDLTADVGGGSNAPAMNPMEFMPEAPAMPVVAPGLTIGDNAQVSGNSDVKVAESTAVDGNDMVGQVNVTTTDTQESAVGEWVIGFVTRLIALILVALLVTNFMPTFVYDLANQLRQRPLPSVGWGALIYFVFPIVFIVSTLAIILLGIIFNVLRLNLLGSTVFMVGLIVLSSLMIVFILILLFLTKFVVAYPIGQFILNKANPDKANNEMLILVIGLILVTLLISIPFVGAVVNFLIALAGTGTLWLRWRERKMMEAKIA